MNKERRKELKVVVSKLEEAYDRLDAIIADEEEAYDNMPEGLQQSERGTSMEDGIYSMKDALENIDDIKLSLEDMLM